MSIFLYHVRDLLSILVKSTIARVDFEGRHAFQICPLDRDADTYVCVRLMFLVCSAV